jgi:hypothetical protein
MALPPPALPGCDGRAPALELSGQLVSRREVEMDNTILIWIIVAAVVLVAIVATVVMRNRVTTQRARARKIREQADNDRIELERREAEAAKMDAEARMAQAEADARTADAALLQKQAQERSEHARDSRSEVDAQLRTADRIDPDVPDPARRDDDLADGGGGRTSAEVPDRGSARDGSDPPRT